MKGRSIGYYVLIAAFALLPLAGCSGGGGSAGSVATGEKGVSLTVQGQVDAGKTLAKTLGLDAALSGTVKVLNAVDASVLGSANIGADGSFSGLSFTLPATKSIIVFRADTNKAVTPFYTVVPIDLSNPPAPGIGASNAITILISQASTNIASVVSSALGLSGVLPSTTPAVTSGMVGDNALPAGQNFTTAAQLVTQFGGQILAYNTSGLNLTGALKEALLPAQDANTLTGDELLNIVLEGQITGVSIPGSNPIVSFQVTNAATGKGIRGLKAFGLTIAQLKPAANGSPSEWASYQLTPSTATPPVPGRPGFDSGYTVLDNGDGSYTVKFGKDIKNVTNAGKGVTYDGSLTHRVVVQARAAPSPALDITGISVSNFRNEKIMFKDFIPANPAAATMEQRVIVKKQACEACHSKLGVTTPHGGRSDPQLCVTCHTPQRGNGRTGVAGQDATSTNGAFPALTKTVSASGSVSYSPYTYIADGVVIGDFPVLVHKIHMGEELTKKNYNFANVLFNEVALPQPVTNCRTCHIEDTATSPQALNWKDKPSRKACGACHDGVDFATGAGHEGGAYSDDSTCGSCHGPSSPFYPDKVHKPVVPPDPNNIYLNTNTDATKGVTGVGNTNAQWLVGSQTNLPDGVDAISYDVASVTTVPNATDATKKNPSIKFKFKRNGKDVVFNTYSATGKTEMMDGFVGSPSVYFAWAVPQDGIAAPADYNVSAGTYIKNIWRGDGKDVKGAALAATAQGAMTGPDSSGYYTLTMTGVFISSDATLLAGGVGFTYSLTTTQPLTQIVSSIDGKPFAKYPYTPNSEREDPNSTATPKAKVNGGEGGIGGIGTANTIVYKVADGYTARRIVVETAKCNGCHSQLGVGPTFHGGMRNNAQICSFCHTPNRATGHTSAAQGGGGWSVSVKHFIHAIHGGSERTKPFTYEATRDNPAGFSEVVFPGILNDCAKCHIVYDGTTSGPLAGTGATYDFTAAPRVGTVNVPVYTSDLMSRLLWPTAASGTMPTDPASPALSPYVTPGTAYGAAFSYNVNTNVATPADGKNLMFSPIAAVCVACHDSNTAQAHMRTMGASIYAVRSTITSFGVTNEQCLVCHGQGRVMNIKEVHRWR